MHGLQDAVRVRSGVQRGLRRCGCGFEAEEPRSLDPGLGARRRALPGEPVAGDVSERRSDDRGSSLAPPGLAGALSPQRRFSASPLPSLL